MVLYAICVLNYIIVYKIIIYDATRNIHYFGQITNANNLLEYTVQFTLTGPRRRTGARTARKTFTVLVTHLLQYIPPIHSIFVLIEK
jgi:hypothetical protein